MPWMQNYVLKLIYTLFSSVLQPGLGLKCMGYDWKGFCLVLTSQPMLADNYYRQWMLPSLLQSWQQNQTKPKGKSGFLARISSGEGGMTFMSPVSFNLIVCIGPAGEELCNWKEQFAFPALTKRLVMLFWFNSCSPPSVKIESVLKEVH